MKSLKLIPLDVAKLYHSEFAQLVARFLEDFSKSGLSADTDVDFKKTIGDVARIFASIFGSVRPSARQ